MWYVRWGGEGVHHVRTLLSVSVHVRWGGGGLRCAPCENTAECACQMGRGRLRCAPCETACVHHTLHTRNPGVQYSAKHKMFPNNDNIVQDQKKKAVTKHVCNSFIGLLLFTSYAIICY